MILGALHKAGGVAYLARQAKESPAAFMTLVGKVLPTQVTATIKTEAAELSDAELLAIACVTAAGGPGTADEAKGPAEPSRLH
jgi:hypothetical protein